MIVLFILVLLFGLNIANVLAEAGVYFYKDSKFWLSVFSLITLTLLISQHINS